MSVYSKYQMERKRIQEIQRKLESKGYFFNDDVLPNIPKKITQGSVNKLQHITLKTLYNKANLVLDSGELLTGKKALSYELTERRKYINEQREILVMERTAYYDTIYDNFVNYISRVESSVFIALSNTLERMKSEIGKERIAMAMEDMPESFHQVLAEHRYDSEASVSDFTSRLLAYVPELGRLEREQLSDIIDEYSNYDEPLWLNWRNEN